SLAAVAALTRTSKVGVASQNLHFAAEGAYTGEVSPGMVKETGARFAIVGHSERRQYFAETDASVAKKVRAVLDQGLMPIMCVGETESQREAGRTEYVLASQVPAGLAEVETGLAGRVAIAYEPIWAIGTGRTATAAIAQEAVAFVRDQVAATLGAEAAEAVRVLYGGSVRPDNIDELMAQPDIDGVLVGGASLEVASFARIVRFRES
ncbi:MAG TPA: triose-phosphate isomerase, partial [Thermoleophilia bacterium]|nr:triose-phosphate isomerase [Thermoleophilia bacterium]